MQQTDQLFYRIHITGPPGPQISTEAKPKNGFSFLSNEGQNMHKALHGSSPLFAVCAIKF